MFFYGRGSFLVLVLHKKFTMYAARFFCARSTDVLLWSKLAFPIYSARKTLAQLSKKILFTDIDKKKNDSRRRPGKMTDRGLKKKHHRMTPIEHLLTDIMQISFTD